MDCALAADLTDRDFHVYFIHTDMRFAPVAMTNADGDIAWQAEYDPLTPNPATIPIGAATATLGWRNNND